MQFRSLRKRCWNIRCHNAVRHTGLSQYDQCRQSKQGGCVGQFFQVRLQDIQNRLDFGPVKYNSDSGLMLIDAVTLESGQGLRVQQFRDVIALSLGQDYLNLNRSI